MKEFVDKTSEQSGTPINRANLMALQGFQAKTYNFIGNKVIETNSDGETLTTTFNNDGSITETFSGEKEITKTTIFNADGSVSEVLS